CRQPIPDRGGRPWLPQQFAHRALRGYLLRLARGPAQTRRFRQEFVARQPGASKPLPAHGGRHRARIAPAGLASAPYAVPLASHPIASPPSTWITWPVMYAAASEARNATRGATSLTRAILRSGICSMRPAFCVSDRAAVISVSTRPGARAFTVMFRDA